MKFQQIKRNHRDKVLWRVKTEQHSIRFRLLIPWRHEITLQELLWLGPRGELLWLGSCPRTLPPPLFFCDRAERVKTRGKDVSQVETNVSTTWREEAHIEQLPQMMMPERENTSQAIGRPVDGYMSQHVKSGKPSFCTILVPFRSCGELTDS